MSATPGLDQLATCLRDKGLRVTVRSYSASADVTNPLTPKVYEEARCFEGRYWTAWGYDVGEIGDEPSAAGRLAFLLGVVECR
ncbi:hypothetical protein [Actinomadura sp. 6N118]|uniref:hypothetical protein n=1 Tax=Actinomadura sp. 6N118 TaxID=3375151 RepID=UPI0037AAF057